MIAEPEEIEETQIVESVEPGDDNASEEMDFKELLSAEGIADGYSDNEDLEKVRSSLMVEKTIGPANETLSIFAQRLGFEYVGSWGTDSLGVLRINGRVYVPNIGRYRVMILKDHHDNPLVGHQGVEKTCELLRRNYCWLGLRRDVERYIRGCGTCQRTKSSRSRPKGLLNPLEISEGPWQSISMDFIEPLPVSNGYDSILVVVDRLTKWAIFIPTVTTLTAQGLARLIEDHVVCQHGYPKDIVSDRGSKFTSAFWSELSKVSDVGLRLSSAYHPQTDGQAERVNQVLEQYLRVYCNYRQNDWSELLPRASFTYNNSFHSAIQMTPFMANYGFLAKFGIDSWDISGASEAVIEKVEDMRALHEMCKENIRIANEDYAKYYDRRREVAPSFEVDDLVLVSLENMKTQRPSKKLEVKRSGPYRILEKIGDSAYRVELPTSVKYHNVFHVSLLQKFNEPTLKGQTVELPGPIVVDDNLGDSWEVEEIIDSIRYRNNVRYLVKWKGYEGIDSATWQSLIDLDGAMDLVEEFHAKFPEKSRAKPLSKKELKRLGRD